jgi:hypothetical protein
MPLLTIGLLGVQIIWSTEMGYGMYQRHSFITKATFDVPAVQNSRSLLSRVRKEVGYTLTMRSITIPPFPRAI